MKLIQKMKEIPWRAVGFGDGENGSAWQQYRNEDYGLTLTRARKSKDEPFRGVMTVDGIKGEFTNIDSANDAIRAAMTHNAGIKGRACKARPSPEGANLNDLLGVFA